MSDPATLDYAVAERPLAGEAESGDRALVAFLADGALAAAVDGLGHGPAAAEAADAAVETLRAHAHEPLDALAERCDLALRRTRGAAMSLARFSAAEGVLIWLGVGNVEGALLHGDGRDALISARGIVGAGLSGLRPAALALQRGDVLLLATDGIDPAFAETSEPVGSARAIADRILAAHAKPTDDALVLVARYLGDGR